MAEERTHQASSPRGLPQPPCMLARWMQRGETCALGLEDANKERLLELSLRKRPGESLPPHVSVLFKQHFPSDTVRPAGSRRELCG